jgi:hypothetical protein|tara:strand:- start:294 stop:686 length:393 start_codon:yes stop_codon:yes gene_type:complete
MVSLPPAAKRILSIAFVAAVVFFGARTCQVESADCELVFRFRDPVPGELVELQVRLFDTEDNSEPIGTFSKYYEGGATGAPARWPLVISAETYRLEGEIITSKGRFPIERKITLVDGEALSIYLDRYLRE